MSARSMTGYARAKRSGEFGDLAVALKSVNHRGFDMRSYLPVALEGCEPAIRNVIKKSVMRGHLEVRVSLARARQNGRAALNRELFEAYLAAVDEARRVYGVDSDPDLSAALRIPGMLSTDGPADEPSGDIESALLACLDDALVEFNRFREREGAEILAALRTYAEEIRTAAEEMAVQRSRVLPALRVRLSDRIAELLNGLNLDPQRLAQEAAMIAERSDIEEEVARLRVHSQELRQILDNGGEVGKKLDFLLQEMNRETNTVLSKTTGLGEQGLRITEAGLAAKANIERIREQALNLE